MKKLILTSVLLSAISLTSFAQTATTQTAQSAPVAHDLTSKEIKEYKKKLDALCDNLQKELGLTKDQYDKVYEIQKRYMKYVAMYAPDPMPGGLNSNLTSEKNNKMRAVLTPDQLTKYEAMNNK